MTDGTVVLIQECLGQRIENVLVFSNIPEDDTGRQTMADALRSSFSIAVPQTSRHPSWQLNNVRFVYNATLPIFSTPVSFTAGPYVGTSTQPPLANQVSLLVTTSLIAPPPNRGRVYFGGLTEGQMGNDGQFDSGPRDECVAFINDLVNGVPYTGGAGTAFLRIARRDAQGVLVTTNPIEQVIGKLNPAIQRRRRIGQGA